MDGKRSDPCVDIPNPARLAALRQSRLMDSPAEPAFDRLTRLASHVLRVPVAIISLVVAARKPLIVADARTHALLQDDWAIRELGVVAYAGVPLTTPDGYVLGALCVIDVEY